MNVVTPDSLFGWNNYLETFHSIKTLNYHSLSATSIQTSRLQQLTEQRFYYTSLLPQYEISPLSLSL